MTGSFHLVTEDQWRTQEFCSGRGGCSTNSVEDRGQRERGSGGGSPLVRGSAQFPIRFSFVKLSGCRGLLRIYFPWNWEFGSALSKLRYFGGGGLNTPTPPRYATAEDPEILNTVVPYFFVDCLTTPSVAQHHDRKTKTNWK
jgi:hypothetical protein